MGESWKIVPVFGDISNPGTKFQSDALARGSESWNEKLYKLMQILDKFLFTSYHSTFFCANSIEKLNSLRDLNGRKLQVRKNLNIYCPFGIENNHFWAKHTKVSKDIACSMHTLSILFRTLLSYNLRWVRGTPFAFSELYFSKESSGEFALIKNDE